MRFRNAWKSDDRFTDSKSTLASRREVMAKSKFNHLSSGLTMTIDRNPIASADDHLEVIDALYRFGAGVDHNDPALIASAFSKDIVVDFGPCGRKMDLNFPLLTGHETVVGFLSANAGSQTTSHVITNGRVQVEGEIARLRILVDATHLPGGDHSRRCQMMNWYEVELVRDERLWRMRRLVIDNVWFTGDPQVLLGK